MGMTRVTVDGQTLNRRTARMLKCAEGRLGYGLNVIQGSYSSSVPQSAGTHDGGGAIDVSATNNPKEVVHALREVGFAAWHRLPNQGPWVEHIHAIAIGDPELSSGASNQVRDYYNGLNGLIGDRPDDGPRFQPIPVWPINQPEVSLTRLVRQFTVEKKRKTLVVRRVQRMLNKRIDANLLLDGIAGPKTTEAFKKWERKIDAPSVDGIPGLVSLRKLVAGYFTVVK